MTQDKDKAAEPSTHHQPSYATGPTDIPAPGTDPDSQLRDLKTQLARAESTGDTKAVDDLRKQIEKTRREHPAVAKTPQQLAAEARRNAAQGDPAARTRAPQGRTATPTAKTETGGSSGSKVQTTAAGSGSVAGTGGSGTATSGNDATAGGASTGKGKDK